MKSSPDKTVEKILSKFVGCKLPHPKYMTCEWCDELPEAKQSLDSHYLSIFLEKIDGYLNSEDNDGIPNYDVPVMSILNELRTALQDRLGEK